VKPSPGIPDPRDELSFDKRVDVFVLHARGTVEEGRILTSTIEDCGKCAPDRRAVCRRDDAGTFERLCPREAARDVVLEKAAIETEGSAEREERGIRIAFEAA
jgi:hypothetical protein